MTGRTLVLGLAGFAILFGIGLWYFQTRAFYVQTQALMIEVGGTVYPLEDWTGIDAATSPLKLRACFRLAPGTAAALAAATPPAPKAEPLIAPGWFPCFDAERISRDLAEGRASAHHLGPSGFDGVDRVLALYPDGRAYLWRQLNEKYADQ